MYDNSLVSTRLVFTFAPMNFRMTAMPTAITGVPFDMYKLVALAAAAPGGDPSVSTNLAREHHRFPVEF